ncbi:hypothetical protein SAMN02910297_00148 [Methanobrevibacter olleyae]|uniref:Uncharacterized protein n=1 Tax=Methanobrevibacter olleyae TaxID=294671 RepID=A0A1I4FQI0_METOL|nr:hypothetical protein SAMN02910297_00148 [Methanobrevibacter olleyae]
MDKLDFSTKQLSYGYDTEIKVRNFLFSQIIMEYAYGYIPSIIKILKI